MDTGEGMVDSVPGKALGNVQNDIYKKKYEILMSRCREMEQVCCFLFIAFRMLNFKARI